MTLTLHRISRRLGLAMLTAAALLGAERAALAQDTKPAQAAAPAKDFKDERALALLRGMSDTLAGAKTLSFKVRGIVPA
ncbi:hypothetical protein QTH97_36855, partial [Variovorax sp. J22R24]|uniref:hypothetical protein n=1 Tax=Variovorax gracilis TaxID=3053502 RepID=UPI002576D913